MKFASLASLSLSLSLSAIAHPSVAADKDQCGKVTLADMNWNSATLIAHIDQFVLTHAFHCKVELVPGDTMPTGASMIEKGEPDIAPEFWSNSMKEAIDKGISERRLLVAGKALSEGGEEGFWVPEYLVRQYPELKSIEGVLKHTKLFEHPEYSDKSAFYGCPAGWNCQISAGNLFNALKLGQAGFDLVDPGSGAALSGSIARAYERHEPWFGYYWAPTAVLGKYRMVKVDFGVKPDIKEFLSCTTQADCLSPQVTMYPPSPVNTLVTASFAQQSPEAMGYLGRRSFTNQQMNQLLAWMEDSQADGEMAMEYFLREHQDVWQVWLTDAQVEQVVQALKRL
ncbi:ABC transporter substrate-binding protein [Endozoicomonas gorgoniicola]|uniref:ABC transporter substrate-binding protein n=1 Tax=Endozoicomonas gorgoniicola TaxID=1234144 RepID=A0ABT3MRX0_9GAMM|nr:ABC transporter substrate-binding protein [Endozoicomonas gorgoniicola]MCW7552100.1 ABC transporter substrate-binding protein [Endozoicomonas gorgoniicola]